MRFLLSEIAASCGGRLEGPDAEAAGACIDSRACMPGRLFFAMPGSRTDGHAFVDGVLAGGGFAVVSSGPERPGTIRVRSVPDALLAAGGAVRRRLGCRVAAITGSSGKTTTKELLTMALSPLCPTDSSKGNLNNRIGMPLSILDLDPGAGAFVLELGMNHAGELRELGEAAAPDASVITNVGTAHIEFFGSHEALAGAKAELLDTTRRGGFCVIPAGEPVLAERAQARGLRISTIGPCGEFRLRITGPSEAVLEPPGVSIRLSVAGRHLLEDAASALVCAMGFGADPGEAAGAMEGFAGIEGRGTEIRAGCVTIIDESYNANPGSMEACLEALSARTGRKGAVLGDMLELGSGSEALHRRVLGKAASCGLDFVVLVGPSMQSASRDVEWKGIEVIPAGDPAEALESLRAMLPDGVCLLVKGSRSIGLERVVEGLREEAGCCTGSCIP
ncbi:MAG: UDP-N-acetylmuramoyl-tripeptide--D-alanyl-D-alanine ligase [Candidatus Fermentibacter sp.]|nr:UDP-N-acetylmuramoyl-tripeptide--D-alanyl-D-alanine ligase [Candidatus Fermentibacter sp.]